MTLMRLGVDHRASDSCSSTSFFDAPNDSDRRNGLSSHAGHAYSVVQGLIRATLERTFYALGNFSGQPISNKLPTPKKWPPNPNPKSVYVSSISRLSILVFFVRSRILTTAGQEPLNTERT